MIEYKITADSADQRMDRFLKKLLPNAQTGFLMKMLRKKRIKLNGARAEANTLVREGDTVTFYFSQDTFDKFAGKTDAAPQTDALPPKLRALITPPLYEDAHVLAVNKPAGLLTQPDATGDPSVSDIAASLPHGGTFHPAPANRLDRDTSGIVLIAKDYATQKALAEEISERRVTKEYIALVAGVVTEGGTLTGKLTKDAATNTVSVTAERGEANAVLDYAPIEARGELTLLSVRLHTGKTHQIRAQLAEAGHPIVGDAKYGTSGVNWTLSMAYGLHHQVLHARHYAVPALGIDITAPLPADVSRILDQLGFAPPEV